MTGFEKRWANQTKEPFGERLKDSIRPQVGLRDKIGTAQRSVKTLITRLDAKSAKLKEQDARIFTNIVGAMQRHETERASAFSNELAEVRKITRTLTQMKLVLEQISLRMGTVQDFGDVVTSISPIVSVVRGMRGSLQTIIPEAGSEMAEIGNMLNGLITDAGEIGGSFSTVGSSSEESEKILAEASVLAELKSQEKFPEIPTQSNQLDTSGYSQ